VIEYCCSFSRATLEQSSIAHQFPQRIQLISPLSAWHIRKIVRQKILFISNGHGEDLNGSLVLNALRLQQPELELAAMPVVGEGHAYRQSEIEIIGPTQSLPSGGFIYMNRWKFVEDMQAGLVGLLWRQIQAIRHYSRDCTTIFATGDIVVLFMAYLTGKPFTAFIVSTSAYYEDKISVPLPTHWLMRSKRCQTIFTRDRFTAEVLQGQGVTKAIFAGYPVMDVLQPTGQDLHLAPTESMVALLSGSRLPESAVNLGVLLDLVVATQPENSARPLQFRVAVTPNMLEIDSQGSSPLQRTAIQKNWQDLGDGWLIYAPLNIKIFYTANAFADILDRSDLVVGMAGTAIEQAVGLGKPVIQIPGAGPQFTYHFAEAQMRLLGESVRTIGKSVATPTTIAAAAKAIHATLADADYLERCRANGLERVGQAGGSAAIAQTFYDQMQSLPAPQES
jgi:uncharacterized protein (TIGR03492 family)